MLKKNPQNLGAAKDKKNKRNGKVGPLFMFSSLFNEV